MKTNKAAPEAEAHRPETEEPYPGIQLVPWAFQQGREEGLVENRTQRGIMCLCLSFAASSVDALNTQNWLNGFASGLKLKRAGSPSIA